MAMRSIVLGYSAAPSLSLPAALAAREAFCDRAKALGLSVSFVSDRHALATTDSLPLAPRAVHGRWRVVHFDGLLHKRTSLLMYGVKPDVMSDGEAMEHLLNEHGPSSLAWPIGDWAVAAVSSDGLLLACDYFGNRQVFYHVDRDGSVVWSDQSWALAEYAERGDALDWVYLAGALYFLPPAERTPFRDITPIPPGHVGCLGPHGFEVRTHWTPRIRQVRLADQREYAQTFFELLRDGVRERLAAPGLKWVEISGGVDSALIAACVGSCLREDPGLGPVEAVHYTNDRPESSSDTRRARETATRFGLPLRTFALEQMLTRSATACIEDPREPLGAFRESPRIAFEEGAAVLLSGRLGDLITGNREPDRGMLLDLAWREGIRSAGGSLYDWAVFTETPVWYLLAQLVRDRLSSRREANLIESFTKLHDEKNIRQGLGYPRAAALVAPLEEALAEWKRSLAWPGRSGLGFADLWWWFSIQSLRLSASYRSRWSPSAAHRTYALSHRPLVEFVVGCPWTTFLGPSRPRRLIHEQLGELLPRSLVGNITKSDTGTWRIAPLRELWSSLMPPDRTEELRVVDAGLFTREEIAGLDMAFRASRGAPLPIFPRLMPVELWLRTRPRQLGAAHPSTKGGDTYALRKT
jgi:hypothetical protein